MLEYLKIENLALAPELRIDFAPRFNLIAGDNGLGKSFFLDLAWWALTRTWAGNIALPSPSGGFSSAFSKGFRKASGVSRIEYKVKGRADPVQSTFQREDSSWPLPTGRPPIPGIVIYIRIDGGFSVWDPARNYWRKDPGRPSAYHFAADEVWSGLDVNEQRVCEGLERDWVSWQEGQKPQFTVLEQVLKVLSPIAEPLRPGPPQRLFIGEGRDRPTLLIGKQTVPVALASAGVRRILALSYFLVWAWYEHRAAAQILGKRAEDRLVILFDEPETHLHPRWQRTIIPSLLNAVIELRGNSGVDPQVIVATHSPLVAASLESYFNESMDDLIHLNLKEGQVSIDQGVWAKQGDITSWLVSDTFGLEQARSLEAEKAIEAAEAFMRGDKDLPEGLKTKNEIHKELQRLLPAHDEFWPRWIIDGGFLNPKTEIKK
jgi:hypothetical protein